MTAQLTGRLKKLIAFLWLTGVFWIPCRGVQALAQDVPPPCKPRIAVLDFESRSLGDLGWQVAEMLRSAIVVTGRFDVVERSRLEDLMKQKALAESGVTTPSALADFGVFADAQTVVIGSVSKLGSYFYINARVVDVATSVALDARRLKSDSEDGLVDQVDLLAVLIAGGEKGSRELALNPPSPPEPDAEYKSMEFSEEKSESEMVLAGTTRGGGSGSIEFEALSSPEPEPKPAVAVLGFGLFVSEMEHNELDKAIEDRFRAGDCCNLSSSDEIMQNLNPKLDWDHPATLAKSVRWQGVDYLIGGTIINNADGTVTVGIRVLDVERSEVHKFDITGGADKLSALAPIVADRTYQFFNAAMDF